MSGVADADHADRQHGGRVPRRPDKPGPVTIAIGCVGGRHRSAVIASVVAVHLEETGVPGP
jgi:hypothetical protein